MGRKNSLLILFSALAIRLWLMTWNDGGGKGIVAGLGALGCLALALLSKESAAMTPLAELLLVTWLWPRRKPSSRACAVFLLSLGLLGAWWLVHRLVTLPPPPPYQLKLGANVARNACALTLFLWNVPREAMRFMLQQKSLAAGAWAAASLLLQIIGCWLWFRGSADRIRPRDFAAMGVLVVIGLAPYLFLAWNCYEYYTSVALLAYAILAGLAARQSRRTWAALLLLLASSAIATWGNFCLDYPALVARARWGQRQLAILQSQQASDPAAFQLPLRVILNSPEKFQSFGVDGLAFTLNLRTKDIRLLDPKQPGAVEGRVLIVPREGDVHFSAGP